MYVPRGTITTAQAVQRLFELRHPQDAARMRDLEAQSRNLANTQDEAFKQIQAALGQVRQIVISEGERLRDALAEGDLKVTAIQDRDGEQFEVPVSDWRKDTAIRKVMNGFEFDEMRPKNARHYPKTRYFLKKADFRHWADPSSRSANDSPPPHLAAASAEPSGRSQAPAAVPYRLSRGPRPAKRTEIANRMEADFDGRLNVLRTDTLDNLALAYKAARQTVKLARADALAKLSRNSGETLNTDK